MIPLKVDKGPECGSSEENFGLPCSASNLEKDNVLLQYLGNYELFLKWYFTMEK